MNPARPAGAPRSRPASVIGPAARLIERGALLLLLPVLLAPAEAAETPPPLAVTGAVLFDAPSARALPGRTVVVREGRIAEIGPDGTVAIPADARVLPAGGRFLAPGLIDVHHHVSTVLGDSVTPGGGEIMTLVMEPDSLDAYRRRIAAAFLPHGVTTVREAGSDERYLEMMRAWMTPVSWAPDLHFSGGALITRDTTRTPYAGHAEVLGEEGARAKVRAYHDLGFRHVKLYWRLRELEFAAALDEAFRLGMRPFAHIDFKVFSIAGALDLGLTDFEHAYTLFEEVLTPEESGRIYRETTLPMVGDDRRAIFFVNTMEKLNQVGAGDPRLEALVERLAEAGASVTPTIHIFALPYGLAAFPNRVRGEFNDTSEFPPERLRRGRDGFGELQALVKRLHDAGVRLNLGTDAGDPGRAALSEMLLLHGAGIPMAEVLRIATWNGAVTLGLESEIGSIEPGKKAHLVLFDRNPLEDPRAILGAKTVVKDGIVVTSE